MLIVLTFVIFLASGLSTGDWDVPSNIWLRFILIAAISTVLIPILQSMADWAGARDLALMVAFMIILLLMRYLVMVELTVADEWMAAIFATFLVVLILFVIEKVAFALFNVDLGSFI